MKSTTTPQKLAATQVSFTRVCRGCNSEFRAFWRREHPGKANQQFCSVACRNAYHNSPEHFWSLARRGDGCWEWQGYIDPRGYGSILFRGKRQGAHRTAWELTNGPIPEGLYVCHHCDNPVCVRPSHLFIGTVHDNNDDKIRKGRHRWGLGLKPEQQARGEQVRNAKLTEREVREIRQRVRDGERVCDLAKDYPVSNKTIYSIVSRESWAHVE
jgi:hypothetical protein